MREREGATGETKESTLTRAHPPASLCDRSNQCHQQTRLSTKLPPQPLSLPVRNEMLDAWWSVRGRGGGFLGEYFALFPTCLFWCGYDEMLGEGSSRTGENGKRNTSKVRTQLQKQKKKHVAADNPMKKRRRPPLTILPIAPTQANKQHKRDRRRRWPLRANETRRVCVCV